jgi:hypothetical protein
MFLAAVYKYPQRLWRNTDITELLGFRYKSILACDLNAKHPVWNSKVSTPSRFKLLKLFVITDFEILAPQGPTHCTPDGRGDVLDIVVHQNVRLSEVTVTGIQDSDHVPIMFSILDPVRTRGAFLISFLECSRVILRPRGTSATNWPIVPAKDGR